MIATGSRMAEKTNTTHEPRSRLLMVWAGCALVLLIIPLAPTSGFALSLSSQMAIAAVFALSYNMLLGQTGLLSFGHAVFMGIGGFVAIHVLRSVNAGEWQLPLILLPLIGALGGACFGLVFGWFATRRSSTAFAMITLGFGELVYASAFIFVDLYGGEQGITADRTLAPKILGLEFASQLQVYYLIMSWAFIAAVLIFIIGRTPLGRVALATRDNAERVAFIGYNPNRVRFLMFVLSTFFAGMAGSLFAIDYEIVTYGSLGLSASAQVLMMAFIGGSSTFVGPIVGAILITGLQVLLGQYTDLWILYLGVLFAIVIRFAPDGLAGLIAKECASWRLNHIRGRSVLIGLRTIAAVIAAIGFVTLLELASRAKTASVGGAVLRVWGTHVDVMSPWPWLFAGICFLMGLISLRLVHLAAARRMSVADVNGEPK